MIKTMGVQPFIFSEKSLWLLIKSVDDILKYLDHDIIICDGYAFLDRKDLTLENPYDGEQFMKQYFVNGLLISGLFETTENAEFTKIEKRFDELILTITSLLERKLKDSRIDSDHNVFIDRDEDYGDIVIGFWKK